MKTETTKSGLKIYNDSGKHVKTVPSKYKNYLEGVQFDFKKKRLSKQERADLEVKHFESTLKSYEPYIYELIQNSKPAFAQEVNNQGSIRFELVYENKTRLRITREMYLMFPMKEGVMFSNY